MGTRHLKEKNYGADWGDYANFVKLEQSVDPLSEG